MDKYVMKLFKIYDVVIAAHLHFRYKYKIIIDGKIKECYNVGDCMHGKFEGLVIDDNELYFV